MIVNVSRRNLLAGTAGFGVAAMAVGPDARAAGLDMTIPKVRSDVYAKIYATTAEAEVFKYWTVHYYAYLHDGGDMVPHLYDAQPKLLTIETRGRKQI